MSKIPFTLDAWLKDKSQKVETRNGRPVHYIGLDRAGWQVFEVFRTNGTSEYRTYHDSYLYSGPGESTFDLFIVTPEPELSEFEKAIKDLVLAIDEGELQELGVFEEENLGAWAIKKASELLSLARDQFIKDGYIIEKKEFHNTVEKVAPEVMKEVSDKVDMEEALRLEYERGKAETLKDLPRWGVELGDMEYASYGIIGGSVASKENPRVYLNGHSIDLYSLMKLPGFKEDE